MEGDYGYMYSDAYDDVNYYEGRDDFDDDLFYDYGDDEYDYDGSDAAEYYYDERDDVMNEDFNGRDHVDEGPVNDAAFSGSRDGSDDMMSEAYDGSGNADEDYGGSDGSVQERSGEVESDEDGSVDQRSGTLEDAVEDVFQEEGEEEIVDDNQSEPSCASEQEVFADAQNGNYEDEDEEEEYPESDDYEDMVDEYDVDDDIWEGDFISATPWQVDDTWDDVAAMGDEWYDYYDGDEVWDEETNDGRFELRYEDYGGDAIPGEARDAPARDNFVTHTATVEAGSAQDVAPAGDAHCAEGANGVCPICLERLDAQEVGSPWSCRHYFCLGCILEWVQRSNTCPVDRETICKIAVRCRLGSPVTRVVSVMPLGRMAEEA